MIGTVDLGVTVEASFPYNMLVLARHARSFKPFAYVEWAEVA